MCHCGYARDRMSSSPKPKSKQPNVSFINRMAGLPRGTNKAAVRLGMAERTSPRPIREEKTPNGHSEVWVPWVLRSIQVQCFLRYTCACLYAPCFPHKC